MPPSKTPEPCIHSVTVADCASCWYGNYRRMVREYLMLRDIVLDCGDSSIQSAMEAHEIERFGGNTPDKWQRQDDHGTD